MLHFLACPGKKILYAQINMFFGNVPPNLELSNKFKMYQCCIYISIKLFTYTKYRLDELLLIYMPTIKTQLTFSLQ